jgi:hypothetical protein
MTNLAESSKQGYGSKRTALPMMMEEEGRKKKKRRRSRR